ncbi:zinc finger protein Xfin isoform X2 [Pimephales promelas]|uniref:zinc finger protein Xfin isoform X2 n=1 Tax=Pimephales promelas TaxID=90988 RepID=UPI0019555F36|nr:zinc finger protein Xfin isoform X2 [Pimephales promelas]
MTKLQLLHRALNERLMAAVEQIMEMVGGTVLEYEEETIRARKENEILRRRLRWMEGANQADWPGPSEPITLSIPDESNPSPQDESAVNFGFGQESESPIVKTETADHPVYGTTTLPQNIDQGSDVAGTSTGISYGLADGMTWDSGQSYMAPLDFDPTSGTTRVRHWRGYNRRQRMSFACPDCGKVFGKEQRLLIHMRIHSSERPYKYRRRKAFFYGDNKKKKKQLALSQLSRGIEDDLSDCSEQTNRSSASPEQLAPDQKEKPASMSTESDHSSDKEPENRTTAPVQNQRKKDNRANQMEVHCPHCPNRVFARPCQLAMHMKTHTGKALVKRPDEMMDVKMKPPKKKLKNDSVKKAKVKGKRQFHCPECDKAFKLANNLCFHMKTHEAEHSRPTRKMPIQTEPSKEETMEAVPKTTEVQNLQELKKTFACPHCDKVFIREGWLKPHIRTQHRNKNKRRGKFDSGLKKAQRPYYQQLCNGTTVKQGVNQESKKKSKESSKVNAKPSQSSDESNLVVAGYLQKLRKRTTETQEVPKELKQKNEETKNFKDKQRPSSDESNLVVDVPQITTDLPKRGTDESKCALEQSNKDTSDSSSATKLKRMFLCKECGKEFIHEKSLKKHTRKHQGRRLHEEKKRKREQYLGEDKLMEEEGMRWGEEKKKKLDKTSTSNLNPNTKPQGSPNKELRKDKTRGQGPLPCPFCGKVFAWEMRLLMHMQIHSGEKPYSYRQRKKRFYGDLKRGQLPKNHNQETPENNSDKSEESMVEETGNEDESTHPSSSTTRAVSGALASGTETPGMEDQTGSLSLLPQAAIEKPITCDKNNQRTKSEIIKDILSKFSLQPRIVLEPVMTEFKYRSSVSGDLKSGCSKRSGLEHEETPCSGMVDEMVDAVEDEIVGSKVGIISVECSGHGIQNKPAKWQHVIPETEIVPVEVGSPQHDSQSEVELGNFGGPLAVESSEGKNTKSQQEEDYDCYYSGVSKKTAINQLPLIIIDDELEQTNERPAAEHALSECGRMKCDSKCDCNNISTMKLTVIPPTSDLKSLFKETSSGDMKKKIYSESDLVVLSDGEENVVEDVLNSSRGLDEKKTASVPSVQNEQSVVGSNPGENPSSDFIFSASDAIESITTDESTCVHAKSIESASNHTDTEVVTSERNDQSTSIDRLTRDEMAFNTIRQTEDNPMSSVENRSCQTTVTVFADQASTSELNDDRKPLELVSGNETTCEQTGMQ